MSPLYFWKNWPVGSKFALNAFLVLFCAGLIYLAAGYINGPSGVIEWQIQYNQHATEIEVARFERGGFEFIVPADVYLTFTFFQGSALKPPVTAAGIFVAGLVLGILTLLVLCTTLPRFWFFASMALFIAFMVSLRLEVLYLFNIYGKVVPVVILFAFVLLAFFFHVVRPQTTLVIRLAVFALLAGAVAAIVFFFSGVSYPAFHLAVTGYWPGLIITLVVVLISAHEIPARFVYLSSRAGAGRKNALHFTLLCLLYITFLFLLYFSETGIYPVKMSGFLVYLLFIISAVLGLWGLKQRKPFYETILPFAPTGALFYTALSTVALFTAGFLIQAHNDAALKVFREWVLFCHMGYGMIFFTYVVSNFMIMMAQDLPVYKVLYKPTRMPYFTFRLAGLIATLAFVFYMNWKEYVYHALGGYYNNLADLHQQLEKPAFAEAFYQQVRSYAFQNNRANYQLGILESQRHNREEAAHLFELANARRPTPYSYANAGNLFARTGTWFEAIRLYRKGYEVFPDPHLALNLSHAYARVHKTDSAVYFTEVARRHKATRALAESNFLALLGQEYIPVKVDSLAAMLESSNVRQANTHALAAQRRQPVSTPAPEPVNGWLDIPTATQLHNYLINSLGRPDTALLHTIQQAAYDTLNEDYSEALKAALAYAQYYRLNVTEAFNLISEVSFLTYSHEGRYQYIQGIWATEQGAYEQAMHHFERAAEAGYKNAHAYLAIATALAGYPQKAVQTADQLLQSPDSSTRLVASQIKAILLTRADELKADNDRYLYCLYRIKASDVRPFEDLLQRITDEHYRALALISMSQKQLKTDNISGALYYAGRLNALNITEPEVAQKIARYQLLIYAVTKDFRALKEKLGERLPFRDFERQHLTLFKALIAEEEGKLEEAARWFEQLAAQNPFFEEGIMEAARFYSQHHSDEFAAYNLLAENIQRNRYSYRLLKTFCAEAERLGLDTYAQSARQRAEEIRQRL